MDLIPTTNTLFQSNFTANDIYTGIWLAQSSHTGSNCADQALLIDVAPAVDVDAFPHRALWLSSMLLWNIVQSQNLIATKNIQDAIRSAPWKNLGTVDKPIQTNTPGFNVTAAGYTFNLAAQTILPPSLSYVDGGQPSSAQLSQVGPAALTALDRMYSWASGGLCFIPVQIISLMNP